MRNWGEGERQLCHWFSILNRGLDDVRGDVQATFPWRWTRILDVLAPPQRPRATIKFVDLPQLGNKEVR